MKHWKLLIAAAAAAVSYTSCVDLDETLYSAVSSENYYNTRMDVVRAVFRPFEHGYYSIQSRQVIEELSADLVATWQKDDWWYDGGNGPGCTTIHGLRKKT